MSPRTSSQFEEIREEKRDLIINTALRLFANNGYYSTPISKIAKEADISKGLIYNYFESKEDLLISIMDLFIEKVGLLINPNSDDEITNEEMENFFTLLIDSMKNDNDLWKLQIQLSTQKEVSELVKSRMNTGNFLKQQQLIYKYFRDRFENPEEEMLFYASIIKGFSLQFVLVPEMFSDKTVNNLLSRLKKLFIKEKL
jgi:AcrR family transcriptional regulator